MVRGFEGSKPNEPEVSAKINGLAILTRVGLGSAKATAAPASPTDAAVLRSRGPHQTVESRRCRCQGGDLDDALIRQRDEFASDQ